MMLQWMLVLAAQGIAAPGDSRFDVQCAIATQSAHDQAEEALKPTLLLSVMFYFGRVDAALSGQEIERLFDEEAQALGQQPLGPLLSQCGKFMETRGKAMEQIGNRLAAREKARSVD